MLLRVTDPPTSYQQHANVAPVPRIQPYDITCADKAKKWGFSNQLADN